jgi:IclR family acetate operon transcriptional repressor
MPNARPSDSSTASGSTQPPGSRQHADPPSAEGQEAGTGGLTSVDNALWLLQMVGERQALRVAEAADLLGVARSTAHRLLSALRRRGFVMQDRPNGAYRPGPALHAVGLSAISRIDIRRIARPILEELQEETTETASLAVLEGTNIRFVDAVESTRAVRVGNRTGLVRLAHTSAVGKAILAALPINELRRRYPQEELATLTPAAVASREALFEELEGIRQQGYALNWEESVESTSAIAVALRDPTGTPVAAVAVAAPSSRMRSVDAVRAFGPAVVSAAERIEEMMRAPQ